MSNNLYSAIRLELRNDSLLTEAEKRRKEAFEEMRREDQKNSLEHYIADEIARRGGASLEELKKDSRYKVYASGFVQAIFKEFGLLRVLAELLVCGPATNPKTDMLSVVGDEAGACPLPLFSTVKDGPALAKAISLVKGSSYERGKTEGLSQLEIAVSAGGQKRKLDPADETPLSASNKKVKASASEQTALEKYEQYTRLAVYKKNTHPVRPLLGSEAMSFTTSGQYSVADHPLFSKTAGKHAKEASRLKAINDALTLMWSIGTGLAIKSHADHSIIRGHYVPCVSYFAPGGTLRRCVEYLLMHIGVFVRRELDMGTTIALSPKPGYSLFPFYRGVIGWDTVDGLKYYEAMSLSSTSFNGFSGLAFIKSLMKEYQDMDVVIEAGELNVEKRGARKHRRASPVVRVSKAGAGERTRQTARDAKHDRARTNERSGRAENPREKSDAGDVSSSSSNSFVVYDDDDDVVMEGVRQHDEPTRVNPPVAISGNTTRAEQGLPDPSVPVIWGGRLEYLGTTFTELAHIGTGKVRADNGTWRDLTDFEGYALLVLLLKMKGLSTHDPGVYGDFIICDGVAYTRDENGLRSLSKACSNGNAVARIRDRIAQEEKEIKDGKWNALQAEKEAEEDRFDVPTLYSSTKTVLYGYATFSWRGSDFVTRVNISRYSESMKYSILALLYMGKSGNRATPLPAKYGRVVFYDSTAYRLNKEGKEDLIKRIQGKKLPEDVLNHILAIANAIYEPFVYEE